MHLDLFIFDGRRQSLDFLFVSYSNSSTEFSAFYNVISVVYKSIENKSIKWCMFEYKRISTYSCNSAFSSEICRKTIIV